MQQNRLLELDAIRGIAVLVVVIYHYFYRYNGIYGHENLTVDWAYIGKYGVQLFFIVSGFVIYWTLNKVNKPMDFIISRFSRLYPAYWVAAILTLSIIWIYGLPSRELDADQAIMNIFMFHEYFNIKHIDGVYWTLTVELTFYFWIFIFYLTGLLKYSEYLLSSIVLISIFQSQGVIEIPWLLNKILIVEYVSYFMAGICFYKIANNVANRWTWVVLIFGLVSTIFMLSTKIFILVTMFYVFIYLATTGKLNFLSIKPLVFLGGISYSLYLLHQNIGYVIINEFYRQDLNPIIGIFTATLSTIFLAYVITTYVEKPSLFVIRNIYSKYPKVRNKEISK
jgi:peptidoglycan/LPS O-acetylase OafA/YrhL